MAAHAWKFHPADVEKARRLGALDDKVKPCNLDKLTELALELAARWLSRKPHGEEPYSPALPGPCLRRSPLIRLG